MNRLRSGNPTLWRPPSINGLWMPREANLGGVRLPEDALPGLTMRLRNRTLYLGSDVGAIALDYGVSPASIDILIVRGPNRWRLIPGIFQYQHAQLRLCLDLSGARRPGDFLSVLGSRHLVASYERAPDGDASVVAAELVKPAQIRPTASTDST